jgi:hypothetical protein
MFANAFRSSRLAWVQLPGTSGLKCQTLLINCRSGCSLISNVGQPQGFFKHLF